MMRAGRSDLPKGWVVTGQSQIRVWQYLGSTILRPVAGADPRLTVVPLGTNGFDLTFDSTSGFSYALESANSLSPPVSWLPLSNVAGNGSPITILDSRSFVPQRFYRVRIQ